MLSSGLKLAYGKLVNVYDLLNHLWRGVTGSESTARQRNIDPNPG